MSGDERREDGRRCDEMRPAEIQVDWLAAADGSALIRMGSTRVLCCASLEEEVPAFLRSEDGRGGWITAEYRLLPASTGRRTAREGDRLKGRTAEIQRLIGRSLRAGVRLAELPGLTVTVDCDVLEADGGTRTAAVTGAWVALRSALARRLGAEAAASLLVEPWLAAISVGMVDGRPVLDLPYPEDHRAEVDMNVVALGSDQLIEVQATAEHGVYDRSALGAMLELALGGIQELQAIQAAALAAVP